MRLSLLLLTLPTFVACSYTEEDFAEDYTTEYCGLLEECESDYVTYLTDQGLDEQSAQATYDGTRAMLCTNELEDSDDSCEFDSEAGKACMDGIEVMTCDDLISNNVPSECSNICE